MALQLKSVEAARGPRWVADAFRLFMRRPIAFLFMAAAFFIAAEMVRWLAPALAALPLMALPLMALPLMALPLLSLGFMIAAQSALLGGPVRPSQFIEPLRTDPARRRALLVLCLSYGIAMIAIGLLFDTVSNHFLARLQLVSAKGEGAQPELEALFSEPELSQALLLVSVLGSLLSVLYWHAPALVHWGGQGVRQALFSSTLALWRNKAAFCTYMLTWAGLVLLYMLVLTIVPGAIGLQDWPELLGLPGGLVLSAVFYISVLFTFNDSFGGEASGPLAG